MKSIQDLLIEAEKESFREAARMAKKHGTKLVFWEDGKIIQRSPTPEDLSGENIEPIKLD